MSTSQVQLISRSYPKQMGELPRRQPRKAHREISWAHVITKSPKAAARPSTIRGDIARQGQAVGTAGISSRSRKIAVNLVGHRVRKGAGNRRAPFWRFGQDVYGRLRREVAVTLIRCREKKLILNDGPGEGSSELAVPELRLLFPGLIDERVVGVHTVIAPESKRRAMQFVCAGLGHHIDDR